MKIKDKSNPSLFYSDFRKLDNWLFSKKTFTVIAVFSALYFLLPLTQKITSNFFVKEEKATSPFVDVIIILLSLFIVGYILYKLSMRFKPSFNQYLLITIILFEYSFFRFSNSGFTYDRFDVCDGIAYLDSLVFPLALFPILKFIEFEWLQKYKPNNDEVKNTYYEDKPKINIFEDDALVNEVYNVITNNKFEGSFSIGIMATWGHGKSTFINGIKQKLETDIVSNAVIEINFSPFLNHKEEDVVTEFFTAFSNQLSRYSGRLSKSLISYASSISKLYKRGEITDVLTKGGLISEKPAYELYQEINDQIGEIDRKIIVFIDDLDRLSSKEILQVFKLVRNTSDFRNTFFILALDKTYVVNALATDKSFMESTFIDKFFQLEIFLPEINKRLLVEHLSSLLRNSNKFNDGTLEIITQTIYEGNTLFNDYVKNYRDCIRLANQIIFDHAILENLLRNIALKDFLNLIFLRTRFPQVFTDLQQNTQRYLTLSKDKFTLRAKTTSEINQTPIIPFLSNEEDNDYSSYEIDDLIKPTKSEYNFTYYERELLFQTLRALFDQNHVAHDCIMYSRNFYRLFRSRFANDDLKDDEFEQLLDLTSSSNWNILLNELLTSGKGEQLIIRISLHNITSKDELKRLVSVVFHMLRNSKQYNFFEDTFIYQLAAYLTRTNNSIDRYMRLTIEETKDIVTEEYFNNEKVNIDDRIRFLKLLISGSLDSKLWGFSKKELSGFVIEFFKKYLEDHDGNIWNIDDFTCFRHLHTLKEYTDGKILKHLLIDYLVRNDISVFCSQILEIDAFHILYYQVSDFLVELFGDYTAFKTFLMDHKDADLDSVKEFLVFYDLMTIVSFNRHLKFIFKYLPTRDYQLHSRISETEAKVSNDGAELFVKLDNSLKDHVIKLEEGNFQFRQKQINYNKVDYILYTTTHASAPGLIQFVFSQLKTQLSKDLSKTTVFRFKRDNMTAEILDDKGKLLVSTYSFQYGNNELVDKKLSALDSGAN